MKIVYIATVDGTPLNKQQTVLLLRDALHDFMRHRKDIVEYVNKRYPDWTNEQKKKKYEEVAIRVDTAAQLFNTIDIKE